MSEGELSPTDNPGEFQFTMPAPEGSRFSKEALDKNVGKQVPLKGLGVEGVGTITAVEVIDDGELGLITIRLGSNNGDV